MRIIKSQVVPLESVKPNDYNPNEMEEREFMFLKDMIDKYGFSQALQSHSVRLFDTGFICRVGI
jgi:hypothetical protein